MFDGVFSFLKLRDIEFGLATIEASEPNLVLSDGGQNGTEEEQKQTFSPQTHLHCCWLDICIWLDNAGL